MSHMQLALAEAVRTRCIEAATVAYEDASVSGLCAAGARECALEALRALDVAAIVEQVEKAAACQSDSSKQQH